MTHRRSRPLLSRRAFLRRTAAAGLIVGADARWLFSAITQRTVTGKVTGDGAPLSGVRVSDGLRVVTTDARGEFSLEVGPDSGRFVFVVTPRGYWTDEFHLPSAKAASEGRVDFELSAHPQPDRFRFVF